MQPKNRAGVKTSEFWITIATALATIAGTVGGLIPGEWGVLALAIESALYGFLRTWNKREGVTSAKIKQELAGALWSTQLPSVQRFEPGAVELRHDQGPGSPGGPPPDPG